MKFVVEDPGILLELLCQKLAPMSRTNVRKLIRRGTVTVDGAAVRRGDVELTAGQAIDSQGSSEPAKGTGPFPVLYEDRDILAVHKPSGLLTIATADERTKTLHRKLNDSLEEKTRGRERVFIVHRLDREVSGIVLFAKSREVQEILQRGWADTEKLYFALVEGHPPEREGTIETWLRESRAHKVFSTSKGPEAKFSVTHWREVRALGRHTLLEIQLKTGRKHQIRAHLSELGCPIVGDRRYGASRSPIHRFGLCAYSLGFEHPFSREWIQLEIPIPKVMRSFRS